jgi:CMP-N,N'-diacetyllegionaminic acid synthase
MTYLCLIPARGGSKGIPGKNLRHLAGKPLLVWTIEQALQAAVDLRVVVSTESETISAVAMEAGAEIPFRRPPEIADDTATTESAVLHALDALAQQGFQPEAVVLLQATSPIRLPGSIHRAVRHFESSGADSVVGVVRQAPWAWRKGDPPMAEYDTDMRPRRQDLAPEHFLYRETGSIYVTKTSVYRETQNRLGGTISLFEMDEVEGIDIDTELDFKIAEFALEQQRAGPT